MNELLEKVRLLTDTATRIGPVLDVAASDVPSPLTLPLGIYSIRAMVAAAYICEGTSFEAARAYYLPIDAEVMWTSEPGARQLTINCGVGGTARITQRRAWPS